MHTEYSDPLVYENFGVQNSLDLEYKEMYTDKAKFKVKNCVYNSIYYINYSKA